MTGAEVEGPSAGGGDAGKLGVEGAGAEMGVWLLTFFSGWGSSSYSMISTSSATLLDDFLDRSMLALTLGRSSFTSGGACTTTSSMTFCSPSISFS